MHVGWHGRRRGARLLDRLYNSAALNESTISTSCWTSCSLRRLWRWWGLLSRRQGGIDEELFGVRALWLTTVQPLLCEEKSFLVIPQSLCKLALGFHYPCLDGLEQGVSLLHVVCESDQSFGVLLERSLSRKDPRA